MLEGWNIGKKKEAETPQKSEEVKAPIPETETVDVGSPLPQQEVLEPSSPTSSPETSEEPTHFDDLLGEEEPIEETLAASGDIISMDQFHEYMFCGGFGVLSTVTNYQSFSVPKEDGSGRAASDALYRFISRTPWLRAMLKPQSQFLTDIMAIGWFSFTMYRNVCAETAEKVAARKQEQGGQAHKVAEPSQPREDGEPTPEQALALIGDAS